MPKRTTKKSAEGGRRRQRHLSVRGELRKQPDVERIAKVVIAMAMAQAEKEAEEQADRTGKARP